MPGASFPLSRGGSRRTWLNMPTPRTPLLAGLFILGALALPGAEAAAETILSAAVPEAAAGPATNRAAAAPATRIEPGSLLAALRPDYARFIGRMRPLTGEVLDGIEARRIYMALVRPGAADPASTASAPYLGPDVRNDILYDTASIGGDRSAAWSLLLLDHEYFHARHLAGATSLPLPERVLPEVERHFYEAAAWAWNVAEARSGRYDGLRPDEFREALDRCGEHYAALRSLTQERWPAVWASYSELLRRPTLLTPPPERAPVTTARSLRSRAPGRPSGWDRSPAIP